MPAGKSINDLKFFKSFITGRSTIWLFTNFHLFFSSKSRSSFLDSSASFNPVINGKLIVNKKIHMELSQHVIVSQNFFKTALNFKSLFIKLNRINTDSTARPAPLSWLELYVRKSFFDHTKICNPRLSLWLSWLLVSDVIIALWKPAFLWPFLATKKRSTTVIARLHYKDLLLLNQNKVMFK